MSHDLTRHNIHINTTTLNEGPIRLAYELLKQYIAEDVYYWKAKPFRYITNDDQDYIVIDIYNQSKPIIKIDIYTQGRKWDQ